MAPVNTTEETGLSKAKKAAGNAQKLAALLDISAAAVSKWGDEVPLAWLLKVEKATGISRRELRPDLFGDAATPTRPKRRRSLSANNQRRAA